jgi:outer membrane protein insertion porin family
MVTVGVRYHLGNVRLRVLLALLAGLAPAFGQGVATLPETVWEGRIISRIDWVPAEQPLSQTELDRLLPLRKGSPLSMASVREAIQKLYLTGRYSDVSIDANADGTGVALRVSTELNYFISRVDVQGENDPPNRNQLITASRLELGTLLVEADLKEAVEAMLARLTANGLYNAKIQYRVERIDKTEEAKVGFDLVTGSRASFDGADLLGSFTRTKQQIIRSTGWLGGLGPVPVPNWFPNVLRFPLWREVTDNRVQTGLDRIRRSLEQGNHLKADVTLNKLDYHPATNTATPQVTIDSGPVIEVRTPGAKLGQSTLRDLLPIYQERSVDAGLLREGQLNLRQYFESKGYFDVKVEDAQASESLIEYQVQLGERHKLKQIEIEGNQYFKTETLRQRMYISQAGFLRSRYGRFSDRLLTQDENTLRDLYRANGFRDAEVKHVTPIEDSYGGKHGNLAVKLEVHEGQQVLVDQFQIEGASQEDEEYLRSNLRSTEGQPFSDANVAADRDTILSYYYNNGYPDASFEETQGPEPAPYRVNLHYKIVPGKQQFVRDVLMQGTQTTRNSLVKSRILLAPGDAISQSKIAESQQKLYDLGIFSKVQTAIQNPDGEEDSKYVLFLLEEARKYSFNFGVGAELARIGTGTTTFDNPAGGTGFSPRISAGISRLNFLGLGHTVSLQTLASTLEQRALLTYLAPQFEGHESLALTFSALFDDSNDVRTFAARRWEGSVQLSKRFSRANTGQIRYTFRRVTLDPNSLKISPGLIPLLSQPDRVGLVAMTFFQDRRDDSVTTHRGFYNSMDLGLAAKAFGSETDFTRLLLRNSTYHPFGKDIVLARSLQFGYIQRLGGIPDIPLAERFYAGGASSNRAFPDNQAGPRDLETGFPIGGQALLFHSTELRFPLIGDNLGGVLFHDMGNVYSDIRNISFRFHQQGLQDFNYMVHSIGFGIRYRLPIGPIRADLSYGPNSPRFFGFAGTLDQLLAGQGTLVNQRINQFQFHFSLGQTF